MAAADIVTRSSPDGKGRPVTTAANADNSVEVRPNRGATISDIEAIGPESQPLQEWQKEAGIDTSKQTKLVKLAHVRYQHPDLTDLKKFLLDFGMHVAKQTDAEMWFRGYGADPYVYYARKGPKKFLGGSFQVESEEELEKASRLPGAQPPIQDLTDAPGGGSLLTLLDPEGFPINLIHGQTPAATGAAWPANLVYNPAGPDKPRVRSFNRFTPGPAAVHKLGHYGLCVQDVPTQLRWYTRNFNFAPTDFLYVRAEGAAGRREVGVFMHLDRGETCVDHHAFFISANPTAHVHHASFEVHDYDTQHLGHQWLARRGYTSVWGVGRHVLGSQIFDYWWDPTGNMIEHYADGDLVNKDTPVGWGPAGDESLAVWGPEVPSWFLH